MTWNYRIFKHDNGKRIFYGLHEAYYNDKGKVNGWTKEPEVVGDTVKDLLKTLDMMKQDALKYKDDIIKYE